MLQKQIFRGKLQLSRWFDVKSVEILSVFKLKWLLSNIFSSFEFTQTASTALIKVTQYLHSNLHAYRHFMGNETAWSRKEFMITWGFWVSVSSYVWLFISETFYQSQNSVVLLFLLFIASWFIETLVSNMQPMGQKWPLSESNLAGLSSFQ